MESRNTTFAGNSRSPNEKILARKAGPPPIVMYYVYVKKENRVKFGNRLEIGGGQFHPLERLG